MTIATTPLSGSYVADPVHSSFGFAVRYQGVSIYRGSFERVEARLVDGRLEGAATVESISIRSPEAFRAHVLSGEFFDAERHPEVRFASSSVDLADDGTATVAGELTIKGITRQVEFDATVQGTASDPWGGERVGSRRWARSTAAISISTGTSRPLAASRWPPTK
jgi:polyisoprenoid-binding protein YceI